MGIRANSSSHPLMFVTFQRSDYTLVNGYRMDTCEVMIYLAGSRIEASWRMI